MNLKYLFDVSEPSVRTSFEYISSIVKTVEVRTRGDVYETIILRPALQNGDLHDTRTLAGKVPVEVRRIDLQIILYTNTLKGHYWDTSRARARAWYG